LASKKNGSIVVAAGVKGFLNIIFSLITFKWIFESNKLPDIHKSSAE
jgi:hypothetical protein